MPTIQDIVIHFLRENGYKGLCNPDAECGCEIDDLFPCDDGYSPDECQAAMSRIATEEDREEMDVEVGDMIYFVPKEAP